MKRMRKTFCRMSSISSPKVLCWSPLNRLVPGFSGQPGTGSPTSFADDDDDSMSIQDLLPDPADGPEAIYARKIIETELLEALGELPPEQREAFIMNELEDKSFKEMSEITGEGVNTLISRKRYAVLHLRERLKDLYTEFINR
jgi:DNA-directed RNA polymerase specialized sigma24 family protein